MSEEFERQVENLIQKGYSQAAQIKAEAFRQQLAPLGKRIKTLAKLEKESQAGYLPFVIVIKSDWIAADKMMPLVEREGQKGFIQLYPVEARNFKPIEDIKIPAGVAYLLVDIDRGEETLNLAPTDALDKAAWRWFVGGPDAALYSAMNERSVRVFFTRLRETAPSLIGDVVRLANGEAARVGTPTPLPPVAF